ncbi:MAG: pyridoxal phosphate-dependent aminotransferase [Myxococcota bacterium]|nr:pyridoxal phosphate-dependent aminotransferase [Myxococcota bacterium]
MSEPLNPNVLGLQPSATLAINESSKAQIRSGRRVFKLGLGQSPFPVPDCVEQALKDHAGKKDYLSVQGYDPLRDAISCWHNRRQARKTKGQDVVIGPGSKELIFLIQLVSGRQLTLPNPSWVSYAPQAVILGRKTDWIETDFNSGWRIDPSRLDAVCAAGSEIPRLLILNYPNNPSGLTYSADELNAIATVARRHNVVIISDEIYAELAYAGKHISISDYYPEGTIVCSGLSKWCGAGGWRLGYAVIPEALHSIRDALCVVASETFTSVSAPIQYAGLAAFDDNIELTHYVSRSRRLLQSLSQWLTHRLVSQNVSMHAPEGGFYAFPDFGFYEDAFLARGISTSAELAKQILDDTGVAFLPGSCFGRPETEWTTRLSFVDFDGANALNEMANLTMSNTLSIDHLYRLCEPTCQAIDALVHWLSELS